MKNFRTPLDWLTLPIFLMISWIGQSALAQTQTLPLTVVTSTRIETRLDDQVSDITLIDRKQIESSGTNTLSELLSMVPGVTVIPSTIMGANNSLFIRGANNNQTLILIDGQRISSATTGATAFQHIPLEQIEKVEILKGPASSLYGADAMGGVIQIFTRKEFKVGPTMSVSAGTYGTQNGSVGYGLGGTDAGLQFSVGRQRTSGVNDIKKPLGGRYDPYNSDRDGYSQNNASAQVWIRVNPALRLTAGFFGVFDAQKKSDNANCNFDDFLNPICTTAFDNRDKQSLRQYWVAANYQVNEDWKMTTRLGESVDNLRSWLYDPVTTVVSVPFYTTRQNQLSWQNDIKVGPGVILAGIESRNVNVDSSQVFALNQQKTDSVILGYQAWLGQHLYQYSIRKDWVSDFSNKSTQSLGYGYRISPPWMIRGSVGTGFKVPTFNDLYWPSNDYVNFYRGNPNLKPENSINKEVGLIYESSGSKFSWTLYRNKVKDLIAYFYDTDENMGYSVNVNSATLAGQTFDAQWKWRSWTIKGSLDVLDAKDDSSGKTLQRRAPLSGRLDISGRWGAWGWGAGIQGFSHRFNDSANEQRIPGYAILSTRASYQLDPQTALFATVQNAFDKDYTVIRVSSAPYNDYKTMGRSVFVGMRYSPK